MIPNANLAEKQIAVAEDRGEKIIEVMSDSTGELPESVHFLRPDKLFLKNVGAVMSMSDPMKRTAFPRLSGRIRARSNRSETPIRVAEVVFSSTNVSHSRSARRESSQPYWHVVRMNLLLPETDCLRRRSFVAE